MKYYVREFKKFSTYSAFNNFINNLDMTKVKNIYYMLKGYSYIIILEKEI